MKLLTLLTFSTILLSQTRSCSDQNLINPFGHEGNADKSNQMFRKGQISDAINNMTNPPCNSCKNEVEQTRPKSSRPHMIASVSNVSCLKRLGRSNPAPQFKTRSGTKTEERRITEILRGIDRAAGPRTRGLLGGIEFHYKRNLGNGKKSGACIPAHQLNGYISISRECTKTLTKDVVDALIIHEIGHYAANRTNLYSKYNQYVPKEFKCKISNYCTHSSSGIYHRNRNEEFAEAFSAYLTKTGKLKRVCPKSYVFFKKFVFKGDENFYCN